MSRSAWGLEIERDVDWRTAAACGPKTAEWFWLVAGHGPATLSTENKLALLLCDRCPVRDDCYQHQLGSPDRERRIAAGLVWNADGPQRPRLTKPSRRRRAKL